METRNNINKMIFKLWNNHLDFKRIPSKWETIVIPHSVSSGMPDTELFVFEYLEAWRVISVHKKYFEEIKNFIDLEWYSFDSLRNKFESLTWKKSKLLWPVISLYLFSDNKLLTESINVEKLNTENKRVYEDFMNSCVDWEVEEVDMDFDDPTHRFFALYNDWKVVSLWNYSIDDPTKIAHIWIITPKRYQGNGYGKELVNTMVHDIFKNWLIPQYRADDFNVLSMKIAHSLWFEDVLKTYSFIVV